MLIFFKLPIKNRKFFFFEMCLSYLKHQLKYWSIQMVLFYTQNYYICFKSRFSLIFILNSFLRRFIGQIKYGKLLNTYL